ncbi:MAG: di-trans,poly-cis-decaprenylcistransferase [Deltaproteobacteria bacterium]|nr:di-trans,poly-cis-decaprenylcistransferase [Deltaproteobacteria bacterium]
MDGNRRWASLHGEKPWFGHRFGKDKVREFLEWCKRFKIQGLVLYAFSAENFSRPRSEINEIMKLMKQGFDELATDPLISREGIRVRVIGRKKLLPEKVQQSIRTVEDISRDNDAYDLTFAIAYGGRDDIVDACRAIAAKVRSGKLEPSAIDEETVSNHLYAAIDDPDLIIRTSGEQRLSNFLPWQSVYSELHFTSTFWPAFRYIDFLRALRAYQRRDRRIGR